MSQIITKRDLHLRLHPVRQITLSGAASAAMAKQGQFQAFDAETPIVDNSDAGNAAGAFRLRFKPASTRGGPDKLSLVKIYVEPATGNVSAASINGALGEIVAQVGATGSAMIVVRPDPTTGKLDVTIPLSDGASTAATVSVEHRGYSSKPESIASAAA